jgi:ADP-heptose:LPS heptosyltransferase
MGYGGSLIWSGLAKNIKANNPEAEVVFVYKKKIRDYLLNRKYSDNVVYDNNPDIHLVINGLGWALQKYFLRSRRTFVVKLNQALYCEKILKDKVVYRSGAHAIELVCRDYGIENPILATKLVLKKEEIEKADEVLAAAGLAGKKFICLEPNAKKDFTPNKEWPWKNWQELTTKISRLIEQKKLDIKIAQIGAGGGRILDNVIDLTGRTTFRASQRILEKSLFFIATEGGLTHLAASIPKKSLVLLSAMMPRELMAYPQNINFYGEVECKNCGLITPCPHDLKCMKLITADQVYMEVEKELRKLFP